jgi:hypothetical protein
MVESLAGIDPINHTMASSTQDLIPHLQIVNTFGALFIGVVLAAV